MSGGSGSDRHGMKAATEAIRALIADWPGVTAPRATARVLAQAAIDALSTKPTPNCPAGCDCSCCYGYPDKDCHCFTFPCNCGGGPAEHVERAAR